jgi:hypothetical protein
MRAADVALREVTAEASPKRFSVMAIKIVIHGNYSAASYVHGRPNSDLSGHLGLATVCWFVSSTIVTESLAALSRQLSPA